MNWEKRGIVFVILLALGSIIAYFVLAMFPSYLNESTTWEQNLTAISHGFVITGDIDQDNRTDIILSGIANSERITKVYTNNGSAFVENITWEQNFTGLGYSSGSLKDVDNDGDLDFILVGCASGGGLSTCTSFKAFVYVNNGTVFIDNLTWRGDIKAITDGAIDVSDLNNDGRLDIALIGLNDSRRLAEIYINNGTTFSYSNQWSQNLTGLDEAALSLGDVNNDGKNDLILAGDTGSAKWTKIYLNNGTSLNSDLNWTQNLLAVDKPAIVWGDYNNDGRLDLSYIGCCDYHRV